MLLTDDQELVFRNVNPSWIDQGRPTSQTFKPTPKDQGKLSAARSSQVSAEDHFEEFTHELGLRSVGVWAVSLAEAVATGARVVDDQESDGRPSPCPRGHCYIDFRDLTPSAHKVRGRLLLAAATRRGALVTEDDLDALLPKGTS